jgi:hypothetical protein
MKTAASDLESGRLGCGGAISPLADVVVIDGLCPRDYEKRSRNGPM